MPRNRKVQRQLKKDERLNIKSKLGYSDPTPYQAINNIIQNKQAV